MMNQTQYEQIKKENYMVSKKNQRKSSDISQNELNTQQNQQIKKDLNIYQNQFQKSEKESFDESQDGRCFYCPELQQPFKNQFSNNNNRQFDYNLKQQKICNYNNSNDFEISLSNTTSHNQIPRSNQSSDNGLMLTKGSTQRFDNHYTLEQTQSFNKEIKDNINSDTYQKSRSSLCIKQNNENDKKRDYNNIKLDKNDEINKIKLQSDLQQTNRQQYEFQKANMLNEMNYNQSKQKLMKKNSCQEFSQSQHYSTNDTPDMERMLSSWNNCSNIYEYSNFCDKIQLKKVQNRDKINNQNNYLEQIKKEYNSQNIKNNRYNQSYQISDDSFTSNFQKERYCNCSQSNQMQYKQPRTNQQKETLINDYLKTSLQNVDDQKEEQTKDQQDTRQGKQQKKSNKNKKSKNKNENSKIIIKKQQSLEISDRQFTIQNEIKVTKDDTDIISTNNSSEQQIKNQSTSNKMNSQIPSSFQNQSPHNSSFQKEKQSNSEDKDMNCKDQEEDSLGIFRCPIVLEGYNIKLWIIYIDNLIEVMLKLPIELIKQVIMNILLGQQFQRKDLHMWVHFLMILIPVLIFTDNLYIIELKELFDVSYWYHAFRGQSTLKLYGVLMTADVVDKMFCTFGEYLILDVLWQKLPKCSMLNLIKYLIPVILYVFLHSLVLFLSIIAYNIILNSDISFLYVMVFVHNSMKLKSSIFKKFTKDGYTSQTHADLRARFSKCYYVFLIWASMRGFQSDILEKLICFLGSEVIVEWVKHIFLMLLNNLNISIIESMNKYCKIFVAQVRIIPAFQTQQIVINKTMQTFIERENYLAQTPFISPSLKIGFRVNFLAFHHAVIIIKFFYPLMVNNFSYHNFWVCLFYLRLFQVINDLLIYKFSFNHNEIIQLYTLKNQSLFRTLFQKIDLLIFAHGLFSFFKIYQFQFFIQLVQYNKKQM